MKTWCCPLYSICARVRVVLISYSICVRCIPFADSLDGSRRWWRRMKYLSRGGQHAACTHINSWSPSTETIQLAHAVAGMCEFTSINSHQPIRIPLNDCIYHELFIIHECTLSSRQTSNRNKPREWSRMLDVRHRWWKPIISILDDDSSQWCDLN